MANSKKPDGKKSKPERVKEKRPTVVKVRGVTPDFTPRAVRFSSVDHAKIHADRVEAAFAEASLNYHDFSDGILGMYGFMTSAGKVVVDVVNNGGEKPVIFVLKSTVDTVDPDNRWFLVHPCLFFTEVRQVAGDQLFRWQRDVHAFLRPFVLDLPKATTVQSVAAEPAKVLTDAEKEAMARAQMRRDNRNAKKKKRQFVEQNLQVALHHMMKAPIMVAQAATGQMGYCDLSDASGKLIALFGKDGNDTTVSVAFMAESHKLRLDGVVLDDKVFADYIQHGMVNENDRGRMTPEMHARRTALTKYFRSQLEVCGVKFKFGNKQPLLQVA